MKTMFRPLRADEVEVRLSRCTKKGAFFLLYKDARCDMNILDETVGPMRWKREHARDNANCVVSIYDEGTGQWVSKEDTGTESNTEAEKGLASDSFKRACVNWGIGRELYTKINIFIPGITADSGKTDRRGKPVYDLTDPFFRLSAEQMEVQDGKITFLSLCDAKTGVEMFRHGAPSTRPVLVCADCGGAILDARRRDGSIWPAEEMAAYAADLYGVPLCGRCGKAREKGR